MAKILYVIQPHKTGATHRLPVIKAAKTKGHDVAVATQLNSDAWQVIEKAGIALYEIPLTRSGLNPVREFKLIGALYRLYKRFQPDIIHCVSIKPVLFGGMAARWYRKAVAVSTIPGLGYVYSATGRKAWVMRTIVGLLYRIAFGFQWQRVIFQNADDLKLLSKHAGISEEKAVLVRGSGVDESQFIAPVEEPKQKMVLMVARPLADKGIFEFVEVARRIRTLNKDIRFVLVSGQDPHNPSAVPCEVLESWVKEGAIEWVGEQQNVLPFYHSASVVVLPSYREGVPKVLLEAAACARAIVTVDSPGCRDVVLNGKTGYIVPVKDVHQLTEKISALLEDGTKTKRFGAAGREWVIREFSVSRVVRNTLKVYEDLLTLRAYPA